MSACTRCHGIGVSRVVDGLKCSRCMGSGDEPEGVPPEPWPPVREPDPRDAAIARLTARLNEATLLLDRFARWGGPKDEGEALGQIGHDVRNWLVRQKGG